MNLLTLAQADVDALSPVNAGLRGKQIVPIAADDGTFFLNADLLTDCDTGQTWGAFRSVLPKLDLHIGQLTAVLDVERIKVGAQLDPVLAAQLRSKFADVLSANPLAGAIRMQVQAAVKGKT